MRGGLLWRWPEAHQTRDLSSSGAVAGAPALRTEMASSSLELPTAWFRAEGATPAPIAPLAKTRGCSMRMQLPIKETEFPAAGSNSTSSSGAVEARAATTAAGTGRGSCGQVASGRPPPRSSEQSRTALLIWLLDGTVVLRQGESTFFLERAVHNGARDDAEKRGGPARPPSAERRRGRHLGGAASRQAHGLYLAGPQGQLSLSSPPVCLRHDAERGAARRLCPAGRARLGRRRPPGLRCCLRAPPHAGCCGGCVRGGEMFPSTAHCPRQASPPTCRRLARCTPPRAS